MTADEKQCRTVGELREFIKDLPDDATVTLEGCDCVNTMKSASFDEMHSLFLRIE